MTEITVDQYAEFGAAVAGILDGYLQAPNDELLSISLFAMAERFGIEIGMTE